MFKKKNFSNVLQHLEALESIDSIVSKTYNIRLSGLNDGKIKKWLSVNTFL